MRFSVIIPAHNSEKFIAKGLDSIKNQSFQNFELIVVCDRCTDRTKEIAESYGAKIIEVDYGRDGLSRNAGLEVAKGEYILWQDDDDWYLHEFAFSMIDQKLKETNNPEVLIYSFLWKGVGYAKPLNRFNEPYTAVWCKAWRRDWIGNTRFSDVYSVSDADFHKLMFAKPHRRVLFDTPLYYYNYLRKGSISHEMGRTVEGVRKVFGLKG